MSGILEFNLLVFQQVAAFITKACARTKMETWIRQQMRRNKREKAFVFSFFSLNFFFFSYFFPYILWSLAIYLTTWQFRESGKRKIWEYAQHTITIYIYWIFYLRSVWKRKFIKYLLKFINTKITQFTTSCYVSIKIKILIFSD